VPNSYSLFMMSTFPEITVGDVIAAPRQLPLDLQTAGFDEPPRTEFTLQRNIPALNIDVYRVFHEFVVRKSGRAQGVSFQVFIENRYFPAYYYKNNKLLMLKTTKDVAHGAMRELKKASDVDGDRRSISLSSIKNLIERFKGVWFRVADSADVSSQALFGPSVDRDMRFERASEEGEMFYIRLDYQFKSELFHVGISDDSTVVVFDDNLDEQLELELVLDIKSKLLDEAKSK
jgi:hypothetical protein